METFTQSVPKQDQIGMVCRSGERLGVDHRQKYSSHYGRWSDLDASTKGWNHKAQTLRKSQATAHGPARATHRYIFRRPSSGLGVGGRQKRPVHGATWNLSDHG